MQIISEATQQPMPSISSVENQIIQEFEQFDGVDEKYRHLFQLADALPDLAAGLKTEENQVKGCQSTVWFYASIQNGGMHLQADSDSMLIKAISALIVRLVAGRSPVEVLEVNLNFLDKLSIWKLASRQNPGLAAIIGHLHSMACSTLQDKATSQSEHHAAT